VIQVAKKNCINLQDWVNFKELQRLGAFDLAMHIFLNSPLQYGFFSTTTHHEIIWTPAFNPSRVEKHTANIFLKISQPLKIYLRGFLASQVITPRPLSCV